MTKKFKTLEEKMSAESRSRAGARAPELLEEEESDSIRDLVSEIDASFAKTQERAVTDAGDASPTSEAELEQMVGDALRKNRIVPK